MHIRIYEGAQFWVIYEFGWRVEKVLTSAPFNTVSAQLV